MIPSPRLTVLMPVYNSAKYVEQAVRSILDQTFGDFEFIIIDDGSTDESWEILGRIRDPRIALHRNKENLKLIATLSLGLSMCRSEFIARMDSDDLSHPERFARQIALFEQNPKLALVSTDLVQIDANGRRLGETKTQFQLNELMDWRLSFGNIINHPSVMLRKSFVDIAGGYPSEYVRAEDFALWLKLVRLGEIKILHEPLLSYRIHSSSVSSQNYKEQLQSAATAIRDLSLIKELHQLPLNAISAVMTFKGPLTCSEAEAAAVLTILESELSRRFASGTIPADGRLHMVLVILRLAAKVSPRLRFRLIGRALKWWFGDPKQAVTLSQQAAAKAWDFTLTRLRA